MSVLQDPALLWYVNRAAGLVLLVLLTVATVLGISAVDRRTRPRLGPPGCAGRSRGAASPASCSPSCTAGWRSWPWP